MGKDERIEFDLDNLPQGDEKRAAVQDTFDRIAPRYDLVNRIITFGLDVRWRRKAVARLTLPEGSLVLDLACGTGDLSKEAAKQGYCAIGVDFSMPMLLAGGGKQPRVRGDLLGLPIASGAVGGAVCGFAMRNLIDLDRFFAELARVVRAGGRIALLDADEPNSFLLRKGHRVYFHKVVPFIGKLLSDGNAYAYLPKSLTYMPAYAELSEMLGAAGFVAIERVRFVGAQLITATRL